MYRTRMAYLINAGLRSKQQQQQKLHIQSYMNINLIRYFNTIIATIVNAVQCAKHSTAETAEYSRAWNIVTV